MKDSELEDRLFTYLWLSFHVPNTRAGRVGSAHSGGGTARAGRNCGEGRNEGHVSDPGGVIVTNLTQDKEKPLDQRFARYSSN